MVMSKLSKFYDKNKSEMMIKKRYKNCIPSIRLTLKRIIPTENFQKLKKILRSQGWKDWHILLAFFNLVMNYKMMKLGILNNFNSMIEFGEKYPYQEEDENSIYVPLSEFTEENMNKSLEISMPATLNIYGFSMERKKINIYEIHKFLTEKFNYWIDDTEHEPIFDI
ncbi:hypothetical protein ES705_06112 [subsurface metagenome]